MRMILSEKLRFLGLGFLVLLAALIVYRFFGNGIYSSSLGINLVVVGDRTVAIMTVRPKEGFVGWTELPQDLKVKIFNSKAEYPVVSLWEYGVSERNSYEIIEMSIGRAMGVILPRTIKLSGAVSVEGVLASIHKLGLRTDLSVRDRYYIRQYLSEALVSKRVLETDIPKKAFEKVIEPDGKEFLVFNEVIDLWTKNKFIMESVLNEKVDVSVNNLSGMAGLGLLVSRQLESAGLRVVSVETDSNRDIVSASGCYFIVKGEFPLTDELLSQQLRCHRLPLNQGSSGEMGVDIFLK